MSLAPAEPTRARNSTRLSLPEVLGLAAAPTFGVMALLTVLAPSPAMLCAPTSWTLSGMAPMYLLMSAFHLAPWIRLVGGGRGDGNGG